MLALTIDSCSITANVGLVRDDIIIYEAFSNCGNVHSKTLLPMIDQCFTSTSLTPKSLDLIILTIGPGSFTGVRIGAAVAKGFATALNLKVFPVSSLAATAYSANVPENTLICTVMDAKCNQFYNALFLKENNSIKRITEDRAISFENLYKELCQFENHPIYITGDGVDVFKKQEEVNKLIYADMNHRFTNVVGVLNASNSEENSNGLISTEELKINYLRLSQAERERLTKITEMKV